MLDGVRNVARDHARVGAQIGHVHGDVTIGQLPGAALDPVTQLAELRHRLTAARKAETVDEATATAAEEEIALAESLLDAGGHGTGTALIALKRLRGLLADVSALASHVSSIIAAVHRTL